MTFLETTLYHGDYAEVGGGDIIPYLSNDSWKVLRYIEAFWGFKEIPWKCEALLKDIQETSSKLKRLEERLEREHSLDQRDKGRRWSLRIQEAVQEQEYKILARFLEREITDGILTTVLQVTPALLRYSPRIIFSIDRQPSQEFSIFGAPSEDYAPLRIPLPEYMRASDSRIHYSIHVTDTDATGNTRDRVIEEGYFRISKAPAIQKNVQEQTKDIL